MKKVFYVYAFLRGGILKHRKWLAAFSTVTLFVVLWYTYQHEGRIGKIHVDNLDHDGPDPFAFLQSIDPGVLEELAIGEADINPLHASRIVENLDDLEQEAMVRIQTNTSIITDELIYDKDGQEIGLRLLVLSDWGGSPRPPFTTHTQMNVGKALADIANTYDCSFFLSLGDNFCDSGVKDVDDRRFEDTFEDVFTQPSLQRPWYVVAGDKDYKGNVSAQIAYTQVSRRWAFENNYYVMSAHLPTYRNISVDFVMIDTVQLCGPPPTVGSSRQPAGPSDASLAEKQWKWIDHKLKFSSAEYVVVAGHYPVYSGGRYGSTRCLINRLQPLLERYRVSAYFGGHDHSLQHIKSSSVEGGVHYFVAGASSPVDDHPEHLDGVVSRTRYFWTNHLNPDEGGFIYCDVRKDKMLVSFIKSDKVVLYVATVLPRSHVSNLEPVYDSQETSKSKPVAAPVLRKHPHVVPRKQARLRPLAPLRHRAGNSFPRLNKKLPALPRYRNVKMQPHLMQRSNHRPLGRRYRRPL